MWDYDEWLQKRLSENKRWFRNIHTEQIGMLFNQFDAPSGAPCVIIEVGPGFNCWDAGRNWEELTEEDQMRLRKQDDKLVLKGKPQLVVGGFTGRKVFIIDTDNEAQSVGLQIYNWLAEQMEVELAPGSMSSASATIKRPVKITVEWDDVNG